MTFSDIGCAYKEINDHDGYYVTECGEIYSVHKDRICPEGGLHKLKLFIPKNPQKYINILLGDGYRESVHRIVAAHFVEGWFEGAVVNHIDGNNRNNNASNLEWTTQGDNIRKSYITSGMDQTRHYLWWNLFSPDNELVGTFKGANELAKFVNQNKIPACGSSLSKYGRSKGYYVIKTPKNAI